MDSVRRCWVVVTHIVCLPPEQEQSNESKGKEHGENPEAPSPIQIGSDDSSNQWWEEDPSHCSDDVGGHTTASLVDKVKVADYRKGHTLERGGSQALDQTTSKEDVVGR